jgi:hypothetical protein
MKAFYLILIALVAITFSCKKKGRDGSPGPVGQNQFTKQGLISGTVTFTDENNKEQKAPFSYEYYGSLSNSKITYDTINNAPNLSYNINLYRLDFADYNNNFTFNISGGGVSKVLNPTPALSNFNFQLNTIINNKVYTLSNSSSNTPTITNLKFDFTTNHLTFDYTATAMNYGGAKNDGTMQGKVDVILNYEVRNNLALK